MFLFDSCTMNVMTSTEWKRVAAAVVARRAELGMKTAKELAERAQLTPRVIGDVENARRTNYGAGTKAQIEHALGWIPGSIDLVLQGEQPLAVGATENAFKFDRTGRRAQLGYQDAAADRILKLYLSAVGLTQLIKQEPATPQSVRDFADSLAEEILKVLGETVGPDALRALSAGFLRFADIAENHSDYNEEGADHDTDTKPASDADRPPASGTPRETREGEKTARVVHIKRDGLNEQQSSPETEPEELPEDAWAARKRDPRFKPDIPSADDIGEENQDDE